MSTLEYAILVVSFGTSSEEAGISAIEQMELRIQKAFPSCGVYRAWTSGRIRKKILEQKNQKISSVSEALEQIKQDGFRHVRIQPTFVIDGEENQRMMQEALVYADDFTSIKFGVPLLSGADDAEAAAKAISSEIKALPSYTKEDLVVFMGHGAASDPSFLETGDPNSDPNSMYMLVDQYLQQSGNSNMFLRLMNDLDSVDNILSHASAIKPRTIILVPFMIAAGHHAQKDMAGDQESSWASSLTRAGYSVRCIMKGLGESGAIQDLFIEHIHRML